MASKKTAPPPPRLAPRLCLATPIVSDPSALATALPALLGGMNIAAVLVRLAPADDRTLIGRIKTLAPAIQSVGVALLIEGHFELVARSGADGAHLAGVEAMQEALPTLKPDRILGVGALHTRHDAMVAGEAGADYVMFGEPDESGERPAGEAVFDRLQWWAEVFEVPCVGYAATLEEADAFASAGADFVLVRDLIWDDPRGPQQALMDASQAIGQNRIATPETASATER